MSELSPTEQAFLDAAYERLRTTRRTFTEKEALHQAREEGYELKLSFDERFTRAEPRQGDIPREAGLDLDVQRAETRLVDMEELKKLRGGLGESYRQAIHHRLQEINNLLLS